MASAQSSDAARELANARWAGQVVTKALETLASRSAELSPEQLAQLAEIADGEPRG